MAFATPIKRTQSGFPFNETPSDSRAMLTPHDGSPYTPSSVASPQVVAEPAPMSTSDPEQDAALFAENREM